MSTFSRAEKDPEFARILAQERAIIDITERLCDHMAEQNVTPADLARRGRIPKARVMAVLRGDHDSVWIIASLAHALGLRLVLTLEPAQPLVEKTP